MWQDLHNIPPVLRHLLRERIKDFLKNNGGRIETLQGEIRKLQDEYLIVLKDQIQFQPPLVNEKGEEINPGQPPIPQTQPGKSVTEFQQRLTELMNKTTVIV